MNVIDFNFKRKNKGYTVVSLFAGAGGFDISFENKGFKVIWANDIDKDACASKQVTLHPSSPDMVKVNEDLWEFGEGGVTRRLSWQEAAAIQTFPPNMIFEGNLTSKYKQIGNAVPVRLAEVVAEDVKKIIDEYFAYSEKLKVGY